MRNGSSTTLLFVYGTLMRGQRLHHHLQRQNGVLYLGKAKIRAQLYRLRGRGYPGAVRTSRAESFVHGELYQLSNPTETLRIMDKIEGCDEGLFVRKRVDIWHGDEKLRGWAYFYAKPVSRADHVPTGQFVQTRLGAVR
jgi:gamma-glutamylcyclotransferase (GGCT)/AIG2-like uncharacterized protein YtfP